MSRFLVVLICASFLVTCGLLAAPAKKEHKPIVLKRANTLQSFEENGVKRQELSGNVWITQDSISVTCQRAIYYPDSGIAIFRKDVEFHDGHRTLLADEVVYNENTEQIEGSQHVRIYEDTLAVTADRARYFEGLKQGYLFDDVRIKENTRRLLLTGKLGYFDHDKQYARVTGEPVLTEKDSLLKDVAEVRGDTIEYFGIERRARALSNVVVIREGLVATGAKLDYFTKQHYAELLGQPEAIQNQNEIRGDTMRLYFEDEKLNRVEVIGHAVATSPADSGFAEPKNRMEGKKMTLWMDKGKLTGALIEGTATATYYPRDKTKPEGLNETSGDKLRVFFDDKNKISFIRVEGGTEGTYTPEQLVQKK